MRKRIILHAGLPKTASTSIQYFLAARAEELNRRGVWFPVPKERLLPVQNGFGEGPHTGFLPILMGDSFLRGRSVGAEWRNVFSRFAEDSACHTMLISHESIGMGAPRMDLERTRRLLIGFDVRVLVFVRDAEAWLNSLYKQTIRGRGRFAGRPSEFPSLLSYLREGFARNLDPLREIGRLKVVSFDEVRSSPGVIPAFCRICGFPEIWTEDADEPRLNEGRFTASDIAFLRAANAMETPPEVFVRLRRALLRKNATNDIDETGLVFDRALAERVRARYAEDREYLRIEYGLGVPGQSSSPLPTRDPMEISPAKLSRMRALATPHLEEAELEWFDRVGQEASGAEDLLAAPLRSVRQAVNG